ncbi:unnamed protein product [Closterium sp. Naga37s-1]|nr:unnamed protein product [Closterium sp. Naga37s-1]
MSHSATPSCIVDGNKKFRIFSGNFACGIALENLVVQHALNGVHVGACQFAARRVTFQHNVADKSSTGGAVFNSRDSSPTAGSPLQFTTCFFLNNTATGNGGVINVGRDPTGGPDVKIAKCTFSKNSAGGSGGAIYSEGSELYLRQSTFSQNTAARGGGAILTTSPILTSIGTRFSANTVKNGRGGAISMQAQAAVVQFCNSNFRRNKAPVYPVSNDMNAGTSDGTVTACGSTGPRRIRKTPALKEVQSCSGCTGCSNDCNGHGTCALDADLNPYCKCQNQFDPAKACTACKLGYTMESKCVACAPGFFSGQKGRCTVCGTVDKVRGRGDKVGGRGDKVGGRGDKVGGRGDKVGGRGDKVGGRGDKVGGRGDKVGGRGDKVGGRGDKVGGRGDKVGGRGDKVGGRGDKVGGRGDKVAGTSICRQWESVSVRARTRSTVCKLGYTMESKCVACAEGFFSGQKGRCTVCGSVDKVGGCENRACS